MLRKFFGNEETTPVDAQIEAVLASMDDVGVDSDEYPQLLNNLAKLNEIKMSNRRNPVSKDTIVVVVVNLLIAGIVVGAERHTILSNKGFSLIMRPK